MDIFELFKIFNNIAGLLFTVLYFYQWIYLLIGLVCKIKPDNKEHPYHKYAVIVAARNERTVIGQLIDSVNNQNYPKELLDVIVIADNCTDDTASIAREKGAYVFERFNKEKVGKGYALEYLFEKINEELSDKNYEAFIVLDADNLLSVDYVYEMNKVYDSGYKVVTSYRNSKNYENNWISAGYSLWFMREARYLNKPRYILNTSCAISGTGFLVDKKVIDGYGGWKFHLLIEDIQFTCQYALDGGKIGYAEKAEFFDEQPVVFAQSWTQRLRWSRGMYQVLGRYGGKLIKKMFGNFSCFDMMMNITPALIISIATMMLDIIMIILSFFLPTAFTPWDYTLTFLKAIAFYWLILFVVGAITAITEWKKIHVRPLRKIWSMFTFPFFMLTYVPISFAAIFKKNVGWKPIKHNIAKTVDDIKTNKNTVKNKKRKKTSGEDFCVSEKGLDNTQIKNQETEEKICAGDAVLAAFSEDEKSFSENLDIEIGDAVGQENSIKNDDENSDNDKLNDILSSSVKSDETEEIA